MTMEISNLIRNNIKNLQPYTSARDEFKGDTSNMVFLDANENPNETGLNRYPDPFQKELKNVIATLKNCNPKNILIGNGSDEVLDLLFRCFCEPNKDNIITLPPTYGMYGVLANINAVENRTVLLTEAFQPNIDEIIRNIDAFTKMIFLCSPNNPTGNCFSSESITILLERFKGLVVVDEAYIDFSEQESWISALEKYPNLVIIQTLSKAYGLAGARVGILYASEEIIQVLNKIKPPYNSNVMSQAKGIEILKNKESINNQITEINALKQELIKVLLEVEFITKIYPSDANFILLKVDDATKRYTQLIEKGIVVRNRSHEPLCDNCLRITIGTQQENEKLINGLKSL